MLLKVINLNLETSSIYIHTYKYGEHPLKPKAFNSSVI